MKCGRVEEGLAQKPVEDVARALASVARLTRSHEVGGIIAAPTASWLDVIKGEPVSRAAVDTSVVVVSLNGLPPQAFCVGAGHGLEALEKVIRSQTWHEWV